MPRSRCSLVPSQEGGATGSRQREPTATSVARVPSRLSAFFSRNTISHSSPLPSRKQRVTMLGIGWRNVFPNGRRNINPTRLLINLDNGPENSSRRTQFIKRAVDFANQHRVTIRLAYYPTHHKQIRPCRMAPPWIDCDQRSTYLRRNPPKNEAFVP